MKALRHGYALAALLGVSACLPSSGAGPNGTASSAADTRPKLVAMTVSENARVRIKPVKGAKVLTQVRRGQQVQTAGRMDGTEYYLVVLNDGQSGYLHEDFLSTSTAAAKPAPRVAASTPTTSRSRPAASVPPVASTATTSSAVVATPAEEDLSGWRDDGGSGDSGDSGGNTGNAGSSL